MIWPITNRLRSSTALQEFVAVKHGAEPHGPFAPVASATVLRLSLSVSAIRTSLIADSVL